MATACQIAINTARRSVWLLLLLAPGLVAEAFAQRDTLRYDLRKGGFGNDSRFVKSAADSAVVIIRMEYVAEDSKGMQYGRNAQAYYGRTYSIGLRMNGKIYAPKSAFEPVAKPEGAGMDTLRLVRTELMIRPLAGGPFTPWENIPEINGEMGSVADNGGTHFKHRSAQRPNHGKLYYFYTSARYLTDTVRPGSGTAEIDVAWNDNQGEIKNGLALKNGIIGGIYFEEVVSTGNISYQPAGMLVPVPGGYAIQAFNTELTPLRRSDNEQQLKKKPSRR